MELFFLFFFLIFFLLFFLPFILNTLNSIGHKYATEKQKNAQHQNDA
jgi:hypothetical protein